MNQRGINWLLFVLLCIIWGSSFTLMHDSSQLGLTAPQIAALRIFSAGLVFIPFAVFHFNKIPSSKRGLVVLSAVFGNLLPAFLFAEAMTRLDSSLGGILNSLTPLCVVVIGIVFFKDRIEKQKIIGILTGFVGLVLLTLLPVLLDQKEIHFNHLSYTLLILLATLLYGVNVNMVGHYLKNINPVHNATVSLAFMTIPTAIILWQQGFFSLDFQQPGIREAIWKSGLLGVAGSAIATVLFYMLVQRAGIVFASLVTYGIPFVALLWGLYNHERITWIQPFCLGIILLGVFLANRKPRSEARLISGE